MCNKFIYLAFFVLVLVLAGNAMAESLVPIDPATVTTGHVYLFENVGANVPDDSANNHTLNLIGSPQVVDGLKGKALQFNGTSDGVHIPDVATVNTGTFQNRTVIAVFNCANVTKSTKQTIFEEGGNTRGLTIYVHEGLVYVGGWNKGNYTPQWNPGTWISAPIGSNEWHVVSMVIRNGGAGQENDKFEMWMDGILIGKGPGAQLNNHGDDNAIGYTKQNNVFHDGNASAQGGADGHWFEGIIDEIWILNVALTEAELSAIVVSKTMAEDPVPENNTIDVVHDVALAWTPGEFANTHDVYFGTSFEDVNNASRTNPLGVLASQGQTASTYDPAGLLDFGQTYYWRVDEVNAPPDNTIFKGDVWQFTAEPIAYPIADVNATASSSNSANEVPENTINGSGLDDDDLHSADSKAMWLSSMIGQQPTWIQYEFDRVYKLHQMLVWNHNTSLEPVLGFGIKEAVIEYSVDSANWTTLGTTHEFARALGASGYAHNTTIVLSGLTAKYVKITANSNWGGIFNQYGLSEVRFLYIPVLARQFNPASGTIDMAVDNVTLSWRAGREAASHKVYFSDSNQAVIDGTAPVTTVSQASYGPLSLDLGKTYYWRVDEVNEAETPAIWQGDVLNFSTQEYLAVDDFEDYNDFEPDRIFDKWIDGWNVPTNGSQVGYAAPPFAEQTIVRSGNQSMPLNYDNTTASYSEATANVANLPVSQDWTKYNIKTLTLYFYGDPCNVTQQMYVKLNGSKVTYDGDAEDLRRIGWQPWNIELASFGVNLSPLGDALRRNVTELIIGFERSGAVGGKGVVYFDDIRLYPYSRQLITPVEPNNAGLAGYWQFEGNLSDSSGNNRHGTPFGSPAYMVGKIGQAISLDGIGDYVEITGYKGILGPNAVTVTAWIRMTSTATGAIIGWGPNIDGQRFELRIDANRLRTEHHGGNVQGNSSVNDGGWHHVAVTVQANSTISYPEVILWLNGIDDTRPSTDPDAFNLTADLDVSIGRRPASNDRFFMGQIDDVRIYERALSQEEIAWLAGRTQPFDKPF